MPCRNFAPYVGYMSKILDNIEFEKFIFCVPFGILLGHVVSKQGFMVDPAKIVVILNLEIPRNFKQLSEMLGYTRHSVGTKNVSEN